MQKESRHERRVFYGWWVVLVAAIGLFFCYIPVVSFTFGLFSNPLSEEFRWSRAEISAAFSLSLIAMCVAMPLIGRLVDGLGARMVIIPSVLVSGLCLISFYFLSGSLWHYYGAYIALGVAGGASSQMPYSGVISRWFDRRRGLALSLAASGAGLGSLVIPPLAQLLIVGVGWRRAYALMGMAVIAVTVPVVGMFLKESPQSLGLLPDGQAGVTKAREEAEGTSSREATRSYAFWAICVASFFLSSSVVGCLIHLTPMLTDRGVSAEKAALATSLLGGASLIGGLGTGYLLDRFSARHVSAGFFGGASIGIFLFWGDLGEGLTFIAAFLIGLGMGASGQIIPYLVSRYFGLRAFNEIYSYALVSFTLGGVAGPLLMGAGFDINGSYYMTLVFFLLITVVATLLMMRLGPYRELESVRGSAAL
ncbi:MAG TPA: MFS transporter [Blastocatellia bacterium]|nr:MFS transporter [Blastocatellia bacterium]